ncbi:hypothetical protein BD779DRAFT_722887 [Infundibulicybe gibba]|nr:hypothetical protein BD779DRAFT_722887 [Infundibulicybe gibba]
MASSITSLDPQVLQTLVEDSAVKYTNIAFLALLVYDHAITLDWEVSRIWTLPWCFPKILFLINRYPIPLMLIFDSLTPIVKTNQTLQLRNKMDIMVPTIIGLGTVEIMLILRIIALYQHNKRIVYFLVPLFLVEMAAWIAMSIPILLNTKATPGGDSFTGCLYSAPPYYYLAWLIPVGFESIIIALTIFKTLQYKTMGPTLTILARDSAIYFLLMFSVLFANLILSKFGHGFIGSLLIAPSTIIACIAAARMSMNIRQPTDESHTTHELQPMRFHSNTISIFDSSQLGVDTSRIPV